MRCRALVLALILLASPAFAKEPKAYQSGTVVQMASVPCEVSERDAEGLSGEVIRTDSGHKKTQEPVCQEYVLQAEKVIYRIRPRDRKHPLLLPVGERAQFRLEKDKLRLRMEALDNKEREYVTVSMTPRADSTADANPTRLNHLQ